MSDIVNEDTMKRDLAKVGKLGLLLSKPVVNEEEYQFVVDIEAKTSVFIRRVTDFFKPMKENAHKAWKAICDRESEMLATPKRVREQAKERMGEWYEKKERDRKAEERRLQKEAEALAKEQRKDEVKALRESGDKEQAALLKAAPLEVATVQVQNSAAVDGVTFREEIEIDIVNIDEVPDVFIVKTLKLAEAKKAVRDGMASIPGLRIRRVKVPVRR